MALRDTMTRLDADPSVRVIILTGTDPAFCAGLDLRAIGRGEALDDGGDRTDGRQLPFGPTSTPVIGAVNGPAITGGFEVALLCDFLVASERARFADTHTRVGIQPGWGLTVLLPQAVGLRRARQLSFTGNFLDAETALAWGLVNQVVPHAELMATCGALADDIASNDGAAVDRIRTTYAEGSEVTVAEAWRIEQDAGRSWRATGGGRPDEVERRRAAIVERGRRQTAGS
jgi:enoyl-CoA hydratase